jgi:hypothetical protein
VAEGVRGSAGDVRRGAAAIDQVSAAEGDLVGATDQGSVAVAVPAAAIDPVLAVATGLAVVAVADPAEERGRAAMAANRVGSAIVPTGQTGPTIARIIAPIDPAGPTTVPAGIAPVATDGLRNGPTDRTDPIGTTTGITAIGVGTTTTTIGITGTTTIGM